MPKTITSARNSLLGPILLLFLAYIMIGTAPLFILPIENLSPFTIAFYRFFGGSILEFILLLILFAGLKRAINATGVKVSYFGLMKRAMKDYYTFSNPYYFNGRSQFFYLMLTGFVLVTVCVPALYLAYIAGYVVITIIAVDALTVVFIALLNWLRRIEKMDPLKVVYLVLLVAAVFTIAYSTTSNQSTLPGVSSFDIIVIIGIALLSSIFFFILLGKDTSGRIPILQHVPGIKDHTPKINQFVQMTNATMKLLGVHLLGAILVIPATYFLYMIHPTGLIGSLTSGFFTQGLPDFFTIIINPSIIMLFLVVTAIPYFLIMYTSVIWPKSAQKHDLWTSIVSMMEPLVGLYLGKYIWQENIRTDYIIFTTLFLIATIVIKYFSETSNLQVFCFFVKYERGAWDSIYDRLKLVKEIDRIDFLAGLFDLEIMVTVRSMQRLMEIAEFIERIPKVTSSTYSLLEQKF